MLGLWLVLATVGHAAADPGPRASEAEVVRALMRDMRSERKGQRVCFERRSADGRRTESACGRGEHVIAIGPLTWQAGDLVLVSVTESMGGSDSSGGVYTVVRDAKGWRLLGRGARWIT